MAYGILPRKLYTSSAVLKKIESWSSLSEEERSEVKSGVLSYVYEPTVKRKVAYGVLGYILAQYLADYKSEIQSDVASAIFGAEFGLYVVMQLSKLVGANYYPSLLEESVIAGLGGYVSYEAFHRAIMTQTESYYYKQMVTTYNVYTFLGVLVPFVQKLLASNNFDPQDYYAPTS
jgi:hypothetical protein